MRTKNIFTSTLVMINSQRLGFHRVFILNILNKKRPENTYKSSYLKGCNEEPAHKFFKIFYFGSVWVNTKNLKLAEKFMMFFM